MLCVLNNCIPLAVKESDENVLKAAALAPEITDRSSITPVYVYFDGNMLEECDTYDLIIRQSGNFSLKYKIDFLRCLAPLKTMKFKTRDFETRSDH